MLKSYVLYQERFDSAVLIDFAEILLRAHELLRDTPALLAHYRQRFGQLLVDEFQDTNAIQYGFVRLLAGDTEQAESGKVFVVGDDAQALYGWRGAKVENVQKFLQDFPGAPTITQEQNYLSSANNLTAPHALIPHNPARTAHPPWPHTDQSERADP